MRDIEFRGKAIPDDYHNGKGGFDRKEGWVFGLLYDSNGVCIKPKDESPYPVTPGTVGQYTGLKDRKGNKIFEGDLLRRILYNACNPYDPNVEISAVEYKDGCFRWGGECLCIIRDCNEEFDVFGNIHDDRDYGRWNLGR